MSSFSSKKLDSTASIMKKMFLYNKNRNVMRAHDYYKERGSVFFWRGVAPYGEIYDVVVVVIVQG